jgi:hypothetical protein
MAEERIPTTDDDPTYEPPRAEDVETEERPSSSAAGVSNVVGAG